MDREPVIAPAIIAEAIVAILIIAAIAWNVLSITERLSLIAT